MAESDGMFSNQKYQIGVNFGGPWIGKCLYVSWPFGIFYGHRGYFVTIWYIWWVFSGFGIMYQEKSGNPDDKGKKYVGHK
jgi:hypothetical protein